MASNSAHHGEQHQHHEDDEHLPTASELYNTWSIGGLQENDVEELQRSVDDESIRAVQRDARSSNLFELDDIMPLLQEGIQVLVKDDFTRCFAVQKPNHWNWNAYLFPMWLIGVVVRYCILLPIRFVIIFTGICLFTILFSLATTLLIGERRTNAERWCLQFLTKAFILSWTGVIRYHGVQPRRGPNQIFVANHTSMIDVVILMQHMTYAVVGQQHTGLVAFIQNRLFRCLDCLWFDRSEARDRERVATKIKEHILNPKNRPLLIFPEGTCVNNKYCVMFKKGAFELGAEVFPIAIKYNKEFCDPFWNSQKDSFWFHVFKLMTNWAVVCDVYYLPAQTIQPGEQPTDFARRVKEMIAKKARLVSVPWDGYLKRLRPSSRFIKYRQNQYAASMKRRLEINSSNPTSPITSPRGTTTSEVDSLSSLDNSPQVEAQDEAQDEAQVEARNEAAGVPEPSE